MSGHYENQDIKEILRGKNSCDFFGEEHTIEDYYGYFDEDCSLTEDVDGGDILPSVRLFGSNF